MRRRFRAWLARPALPYWAAGLAALLTLPAIGIGWQLDDHFQKLAMLGRAELAPMEAFSFLKGDLERNRRFIDLGYLPWWTPGDFRLAFFRPLTLATVWLDSRLWPDSPELMHAHSLLWFGALIAAAGLLYRRILKPRQLLFYIGSLGRSSIRRFAGFAGSSEPQNERDRGRCRP